MGPRTICGRPYVNISSLGGRRDAVGLREIYILHKFNTKCEKNLRGVNTILTLAPPFDYARMKFRKICHYGYVNKILIKNT